MRSRSLFQAASLLVLGFPVLSAAADVYLNWTVSWVTAAPDGFVRKVIGINGQWPCPEVHVNEGDRLIVTVINQLGDQETSIHWHGIRQTGTPEMDGVTSMTQCGIPPGKTFTYDFTVGNQVGTYWYHSHAPGQYPDGLWGPLIVHDASPPFSYDEEIAVTMSEWYHEPMAELVAIYQSRAGEAYDGAPAPPSGGALFNSAKDVKLYVKPCTTYLVRIICPGNYLGQAFYVDGHDYTVVAIDGLYVEPVLHKAAGFQNISRIAPGQRMDILLTTKNDTSTNYAGVQFMDEAMIFTYKGLPIPPDYNANVTAYLIYNSNTTSLPPQPVVPSSATFFDDTWYHPLEKTAPLGTLLPAPDHQITLLEVAANISGISRYTLNNVTYLEQHVPSLYTALTLNSSYETNPLVYSQVSPYFIKSGEIVEIVINNVNNNLHPWHMHGHSFQVIERSLPDTTNGVWNGIYTGQDNHPLVRDTIMLNNMGYAVIRFKADNPDKSPIEFH